MRTSKDLALLCAQVAIDKKGDRSLIYQVEKLKTFTDYFVITSGSNERQVRAIADEICQMGKRNGFGNPQIEGLEAGRWVLIDFGVVIVHVFHEYIREFYDLESLWNRAPLVKIPEEYYTSSIAADYVAHTT